MAVSSPDGNEVDVGPTNVVKVTNAGNLPYYWVYIGYLLNLTFALLCDAACLWGPGISPSGWSQEVYWRWWRSVAVAAAVDWVGLQIAKSIVATLRCGRTQAGWWLHCSGETGGPEARVASWRGTPAAHVAGRPPQASPASQPSQAQSSV
uniref:Uncharacterized protein n=1 Tax=Eutreptiella gymnastica TaxID=73025 RepID=A0A7S1NVV9_9EUGL